MKLLVQIFYERYFDIKCGLNHANALSLTIVDRKYDLAGQIKLKWSRKFLK